MYSFYQKATRYITILLIVIFSNCNQVNRSVERNDKSIEKADIDTNIVDSSLVQSVEYEDYTDYSDKPILDSNAIGINFKTKGSYASLKSKMRIKQQEFKSKYVQLSDSIEKQRFRDSTGQFLSNILLNEVFPHWYGTVWDFNGITETPGEGFIACGYFVSTTLKHIGVNMNRYKFAQQSGMNGAKTLQMGKELQIYYSRDDIEISKLLVSKLKPGLYQIGLSCHVGYLLIRNQKAYFIHSDYFSLEVKIEDAEFSDAFMSEIYVISDITYNDKLIEKWLLGEEVVVIRD